MKIGKIVDLSMPIGSATIVYPGDPVPLLTPAATIEHDGYHELHVQMRSHSGTHVDAPYHFDAAGSRVDELQLHLFVGSGVVVDATRLAPRTRIDWPVLSPYVPQLGPGVIVLMHTGSPLRAGASAYVDHPFLDADACRRLLDLGVRTICTDALSVDETLGPGQAGESYPVHHLIAKVGGVIGENLCNLHLIDFADPVISCLPIALEGGDGAPVRAVAMELLP